MAGKALQRMRDELAEQKTKARKAIATARSKASSPQAIVPFLLIGLLLGAFLPRLGGDKINRNYRRLARLLVGGAIFFLGFRKRHPIMFLGVGILGSELTASGVEIVGPRMGITNMPEIGAGPVVAELPAHNQTEAQEVMDRIFARQARAEETSHPELP